MTALPVSLVPAAPRRAGPPRAAAAALPAVLIIALACLLAVPGRPGRMLATHARTAAAPLSRAGISRAGLARAGLLRLPAAARGPVSAALAAAAPAYAVRPAAGGLAAENPAQHLSARFGADGVLVRSGATEFGLRLRAAGYGGLLHALAPVRPHARANRVTYAHGAISEWYANGPLGLEQGFTVARAPGAARDHGGLLTLSLEVTANSQPALSADGRSITVRRAGAPAIGYGGLAAWDAGGHPLDARLRLRGSRLLVQVAARGARYPLHIDPFVHAGEKLTVSGLTGPYGYVGMAVALSADGNTALIGAPADSEYTGSAWVFTRSGSTWTQQAKLSGSGTIGEAWFGEGVALSADGNTALVGGGNDNGAVGSAWIFVRSGSTWTQQAGPLAGGGEVGAAHFGQNVALSSDGDTALVGGYNDNEHRGAAWVYTRSGSTWTQQGEKLTGSGELGFFGWGVALSANGSTALVGEWGLGGGVGAALVFTRSGSSWSRQGEALTARGEGGYPWFGYSLALSADGNTAVIGAPHAEGYAGAAWVYTRSGSTWTQDGAPLSGHEEVGEGELGYSTALSADGSLALLGGRVDEGFHGAAWAFQRTGSTWAQYGTKLTGGAEGTNREEFGWSVALSAGAETALVGSPCDKACIGSASVFENPPAPPEFGRCVKVARGAGSYANAGCTTAGGGMDYQWTPGVSAAGLTIALASGSPTLETVGGMEIACSGESGTGSYEGTRRLEDVVLTLSGCEQGSTPCSSAGSPVGEILSNPLEAILGVEKEAAEPVKDRIGLDLSATDGIGALLEFHCGASAVSVRGSVIVAVKSNKMSASASLKYKAAKGKQKPQSFAGEAPDVLEASFAGAAFEQAGLTLTATQASAEAVEVNSVL